MAEIAGHKINNWYLVGGLGGAVLVFYLYERNKNSSTGSASSSTIDPVTGLPASMDNETDPITGLTYLAEAQQYGSVAAAEAYYEQEQNGTGVGASGIASGEPTGYNQLTGGTTPITSTSYANNPAWSAAVTQGLVDLGYNGEDVAQALGLYLNGQPLGTAPDGTSYLSIVQAAIAEYGPPPVGTYSIIPETTKPGSQKVTVPNVVGATGDVAEGTITDAGLVAKFSPARNGSDTYVVTAESPKAGSQVASGSTVTLSVKAESSTTTTPASTAKVKVPNVVGQRAENARPALRQAGLTYNISDTATGTVTKQSPASGTQVAKGSKVDLTLKAN